MYAANRRVQALLALANALLALQVSFRLQNPQKAQPAQWVHAEVTGAVRVGTVLMTAGAAPDLIRHRSR
jgi:hypothetical protein